LNTKDFLRNILQPGEVYQELLDSELSMYVLSILCCGIAAVPSPLFSEDTSQ
jgi:hypothetical protein